MRFTQEQIKEFIKTDIEEWLVLLNELLPQYEITTSARIAGFLAQCAHESGKFSVLQENLNYSAEGLNTVFSKYFVKAGRDASAYAKQPERIANIVYADRMGNGNSASGDGYKFRGRGVIQLTGRENYTKFGQTIGKSADQVVSYLETKKGALESACWYWKTRNLNSAADAYDIEAMTKKINGGTNGLADRKELFERALVMLGDRANTVESLKIGSKGQAVKQLQIALGIASDGDFGLKTEAALKKWQASNGLTADGVAGQQTLTKLLKGEI